MVVKVDDVLLNSAEKQRKVALGAGRNSLLILLRMLRQEGFASRTIDDRGDKIWTATEKFMHEYKCTVTKQIVVLRESYPIPREIKPFDQDEQTRLAWQVRNSARGADVLYHGTRYPLQVLHSNSLLLGTSGDRVISFTRSPDVAAYWALLGRDDDEDRGGILVLNRQSLKCRYRVEPWNALNGWDPDCKDDMDEREERIWGCDVYDLDRHLVAFVPSWRSVKQKWCVRSIAA